MLGDNLRQLEYVKGARHFEDEINRRARFDDLNEELINAYKNRIGAANLDTRQVLAARGFIQSQDGREYFTNAAILLFAKNVMKFEFDCRIRFVRIDGRELQVGDKYNVVKDKSIDEPILRLIPKAQEFIESQLRDFTKQDRKTGKFLSSPEYPAFTWTEGIINAVAHREYALSGLYIKVSMFDDRLEIESPGRFPNIVTADNISYTRFSRNKIISRVMTEFEWVRELNEGVKKIYSDMADAGLPEPEYIETPNTVKLILRNNIDVRKNKTSNKTSSEFLFDGLSNKPLDDGKSGGKSGGINGGKSDRINELLSDDEVALLRLIKKNPAATQKMYAKMSGLSIRKVERMTKKMRDNNIIQRVGTNRKGIWEILE